MKIKKNDKVKIINGKDSGKTAQVEKVLISKSKVLVNGVNIYKKHIKPTQINPQGGITDITKPVDISNVAIVCPNCSKTTKVGYKITKDKKVRICKKCNHSLDK